MRLAQTFKFPADIERLIRAARAWQEKQVNEINSKNNI